MTRLKIHWKQSSPTSTMATVPEGNTLVASSAEGSAISLSNSLTWFSWMWNALAVHRCSQIALKVGLVVYGGGRISILASIVLVYVLVLPLNLNPMSSPCNIVLSVLDLRLVIVVPTMTCVGQLSQTNSSMIVHRIGAAPDSVIARLLRHEYLRSEDHGMIRSFIPD